LAQLKTSEKTQLPRIDFPSDPRKLAVCLGGYNVSLEEEQCYLNRCGVVHLIIKLIKTSPSHNIFLEVIELAVAMLKGGNPDVQVSCFYASKRNKLKHDLEIVHLFSPSQDCTLMPCSLKTEHYIHTVSRLACKFLDSENAQCNLKILCKFLDCVEHTYVHAHNTNTMYAHIISCTHTHTHMSFILELLQSTDH